MADGGSKNIEDVAVGDSVTTWNMAAGRLENQAVRRVASPVHSRMVRLAFADGTETCNTFDHPYFVKGKGWCSWKPTETGARYGLAAAQLAPGDICYKYTNGRLSEVRLSGIREESGTTQTYNLAEVAGNHNFFANGMLVHNKAIMTNLPDAAEAVPLDLLNVKRPEK